jgi:arginyl-tRNA synthetase
MVDLPSGKMKSREGTVVDADDLMQVTDTAQKFRRFRKLDSYSPEEKSKLYSTIGLGLYYILKVDPKKTNPI